jgi:hypothetical protein
VFFSSLEVTAMLRQPVASAVHTQISSMAAQSSLALIIFKNRNSKNSEEKSPALAGSSLPFLGRTNMMRQVWFPAVRAARY